MTNSRYVLVAMALALGMAGCASNGDGQGPYESPGEEMERPPAMDMPEQDGSGSLETQ